MRRLLLIISVLLFTAPGWADETIDYTTYAIRYSISNGNATVREVTIAEGANGSVTVPPTITVSNETYPVVDIYSYAFRNADVKKVFISEGLTTIMANAFNGASNMTEIQIPATVTTIRGGAFSGCSQLQSVTFASVKALCSIDFETVQSNPIYYAKSFKVGDAVQKDITIPGEVAAIKNFVFYNCESLTSVTIEEGVKTVGESAFSGCTSLTSVSIPGTVTTIQKDAFNISSSKLEKAIFKSINSLCAINFAIRNSNPLSLAHHLYFSDNSVEATQVTLPAIETIKPYTFAGASSITEVTVDEKVKKFDTDAFYGCSKISTVNYASVEQLMTMSYGDGISNPLYYGGTPVAANMALGTLAFTKDISNNAFTNAKWLTEITIGPEVKTVGDNAFKGCSNLSKVNFTGTPTLQTIGQEAFRDCAALKAITLPASLKKIGTLAFRSTSLTSITIPAACIDLGASIFEWCTQLATVYFDTSVALTTMPKYIFNNCSNLTSITLPSALTAIDEGAFRNCSKLANPPLTGSLITIGSNAFEGCTGFTNLMLSDAGSLMEIGTSAFSKCSKITMVSLPATIDKIFNYAFSNCTSLSDVYILRETVPSLIFAESFGGLQGSITLHVKNSDAVEVYKASNDIWSTFNPIVAAGNTKLIFYLNDKSLSSIEGESGKPFDQNLIPDYKNGENYFTGWWNANGEIMEIPTVMPAGDMEFYGYQAEELKATDFTYLLQPEEKKNGRNLGARAAIIKAHLTQADTDIKISDKIERFEPGEPQSVLVTYVVDSIAPNAFENAKMYVVELPATIRIIGSNAFKGCQNLQKINIPAALTTISDHLFEGCTGLSTIEIPTTVTEIGYQAFNNTGLTEIAIPASVTTMANEVFKDCKNMEKVVFAENFELTVPKYTFWNCTKLTDVTLRNTMGGLGLNAFQNCDSLKTIELPEGITTISGNAFADCDNLNRITLPSTTSMIGSKAFSGCAKLTQITVNATKKAPPAAKDAFDDTTREKASLYVDVDAQNSFSSTEPWSKFKNRAAQVNHNIIYMVNGTHYKTVATTAGNAVTAETKPEGEGYDGRGFSGWKELPDIMPAEDTTVNGYFQYEIKFYEKDATSEDNRLLKNNEYKFFCGDKVVLPVEALSRSGYKYTLAGLTEDYIKEDDAANADITMPAKDKSVIVTYGKAEEEYEYNNVKYKVFTMEDRAEVIGCSANATTLNIPATVDYKDKSYPVTAIQARAFKGNNKLTSVTINVKTIGDEAFKDCAALATVTMPETLDSIGQQAFTNSGLKSVKVPYAPKMGKEIFYTCTKLTDISFASNLSVLPERIFQNCISLEEEVEIPSQITTIGIYAFGGCASIKILTLSENIKKLGENAFIGVFGEGDQLIVNATELPEASENTFDEEAYTNASLKTSASTAGSPWNKFSHADGSTTPQCAEPTIEYQGGKLIFHCDTEGATIVSNITIADSGENTTNVVELTKNYKVTAYAKMDEYRRSIKAEKVFKFANGDVNLNGEITIADAQLIVNKIVGKIDALAPKLEVEIEPEQGTLDPQ